MNNTIIEALGLRHDELREEVENYTNNVENARYQMNQSRREMAEYTKFKEEAEAKLSEIRLELEKMGEIFDNEVWRNVDKVYETRWDCRTEQREAA
jgi:chromosome segregation ATPase